MKLNWITIAQAQQSVFACVEKYLLFPYWNFIFNYTENLLTFVEGQNIKGICQQNNWKGQLFLAGFI